MPGGTHAPFGSRPARNGELHSVSSSTTSEPASMKRELTSWWKQFSRRNAMKREEEKEPEPRGIFGVPLITSIPYANVAISLYNENGESYIYGYVPIVVAKCGVFLKEKATDVEGIFRLAGSEKRIKELKTAFDTPPRWGKGLDWTGYTVHDAANILRRYFNQLPEPIIPLQHYDAFRQPLRGHQAEAVGVMEGQAPSLGGFDPDAAVRVYQRLIKELPSLNRQLLLYILDLLAVFAAKSDINKMTTSNLAAIFQPGILSHPQHDMSPQDYRLSQDVLIFLIDNQDHFLIGMEGTAVDGETAKHVQSGPSTPQVKTPGTPGRHKSGLGRSASAASSAAAESIRKFGGVRRNVSTSSKHSRRSGAVPSPTGSAFGTPTGSGVHRSNTLPSKRSPAIRSTAFPQEKPPSPLTPVLSASHVPTMANLAPAVSTQTPQSQQSEQRTATHEQPQATNPPPQEQMKAPNNIELPERKIEMMQRTPTDVPGSYPLPSPDVAPPSSNDITPTGPIAASGSQTLAPPPMGLPHGGSPAHTPTKEKSEFVEGPVDGGTPPEGESAVRKILAKVSPSSGDERRDGRKPNKLQKKSRVPSSSTTSARSSSHSLSGAHANAEVQYSQGIPFAMPASQPQPSTSKEAPHLLGDTISSRHSGATLKPSTSPSASYTSHSTATEYSEAEPGDDAHKEERRRFWRGHRRGESKATPTPSQTDLTGSVPGADKSMSSFGSSSGKGGRRSLQYESKEVVDAVVGSPDSKEEKKGGFTSWFKRQRAKSPPPGSHEQGSLQNLAQALPQDGPAARGKSVDIPRSVPAENSSAMAAGATGAPNAAPGSQQAQEVQPGHGASERSAP